MYVYISHVNMFVHMGIVKTICIMVSKAIVIAWTVYIKQENIYMYHHNTGRPVVTTHMHVLICCTNGTNVYVHQQHYCCQPFLQVFVVNVIFQMPCPDQMPVLRCSTWTCKAAHMHCIMRT